MLVKLRAGGHKVRAAALLCLSAQQGTAGTAAAPTHSMWLCLEPTPALDSQPSCPACHGHTPMLHVHRPVQVLLFSTMTRALDVVSDYLGWRGFRHLRLDGGTAAGKRGELVERFNDPGGRRGAARTAGTAWRSVAWRGSAGWRRKDAAWGGAPLWHVSTGTVQHTAYPWLPCVPAGGGVFVFLLSIRAGGVGLNLQGADTVIMYDTGEGG